MTTPQPESLTLSAVRAAVLYGALDLAIANVRDVLVRNSKQSQPYRGAMQMQLAAYEAEKAAPATAFPELRMPA